MKEKQERFGGIGTVVVVSVVLALMGALMLFVPAMKLLYLIYGFGVILLVMGLFAVVFYFKNKKYEMLSNFEFSGGVILMIFGLILLLRGELFVERIYFLIGLLVLLDAVFFLQYTVQMKVLRSHLWALPLVLSVILLIAAMLILMEVEVVFISNRMILHGILFGVGLIGFLGIAMVYFQIRKFRKELQEGLKRNLEEDEDVRVRWSDAKLQGVNKEDEV
ncbi:MAG: DUF308 domain-containing protein [Lachnospiraceae bacterium]|nr:DUF308 domain-containing protein [Lachnospiraceae bacterium]